jgi:hypothetical protein
VFAVSWCPRNPDLIATASYDERVFVSSLLASSQGHSGASLGTPTALVSALAADFRRPQTAAAGTNDTAEVFCFIAYFSYLCNSLFFFFAQSI